MAKNTEVTPGSINLIGTGTVIEGEIRSNGDIRIDGVVNGSITTKARLVLGATGQIDGDITCQNADLSGIVKGKVNVSDILFLKATAKLTGDIITSKLVVESGAIFIGSCNMGPIIKDIKAPEKEKEIKAVV